jgi:hypothetical protein
MSIHPPVNVPFFSIEKLLRMVVIDGVDYKVVEGSFARGD